ncbi:hypothetical protein AVEN_248392-1 [Araneus ventricosus]|uniref:Uncharacterized protein n=1 Tax=Araneus ventricosus TaxID=182803 RepID=A0A4Y2WLE5_ARAVE|nr:hypothetical protein AVEN_248392-1 [Araneus ventricosus]
MSNLDKDPNKANSSMLYPHAVLSEMGITDETDSKNSRRFFSHIYLECQCSLITNRQTIEPPPAQHPLLQSHCRFQREFQTTDQRGRKIDPRARQQGGACLPAEASLARRTQFSTAPATTSLAFLWHHCSHLTPVSEGLREAEGTHPTLLRCKRD